MWVLERGWSLRGHWVEGEPRSTVVEHYDVTAGNAWIVVPLAMAAGPELVRRLAAQTPAPHVKPRSSEDSKPQRLEVVAVLRRRGRLRLLGDLRPLLEVLVA